MRGKEEQGEGRLPDTEDQKVRSVRDISHIDCQEGTMERGETGGNFRDEINDENENNKKNPQ